MNGETDYERRMSDLKCVELGEKIGYKKGFEAARKQFERPHGEWKWCDGDGRTCTDGWLCTSCGTGYHTEVPYFSEFRYCPMCGADMRPKEGEKK